jgi:hypothetical protein
MEVGDMIPNKLIFIYGFKPNDDFLFVHYLAVLSAITINQPDDAILYHHYEPNGHWWAEVKKIIKTEKVDLPTQIFGNQLVHHAHKSDVFRLRKLIEQGGIYLDCDTLCIKPFKPLLQESAVMAYQSPSCYGFNYGLCNATMLAEANNIFMKSWLNRFIAFRSKGQDEHWDEFSVKIPLQLMTGTFYSHDRDITPELLDKYKLKILDYKAFFHPRSFEMDMLFSTTNVEIMNDSYSCHLWESYTSLFLREVVTPEYVSKGNSVYSQLARRVYK